MVPVILDHDGNMDDLLSLMLLLTMPTVKVIGVSVTPADCYGEYAVESTAKILKLFGQEETPIGLGQFHGINPFPRDWRARPKVLNALPLLINVECEAQLAKVQSSVSLMTQLLSQASEPITIVMTGPCSNLVRTLEQSPNLQSKIHSVIWMGGAVDVIGNVRQHTHDGSAEWNAYWDPIASQKLFELGLPLVLVPLDITNQTPVEYSFLKALARQVQHPVSNLAGQIWATTVDALPAYEYTYYMWDILATSFVEIPHAFQCTGMRLAAISSGASAGRTLRDPKAPLTRVAQQLDKEYFYAYILRRFARSFQGIG